MFNRFGVVVAFLGSAALTFFLSCGPTAKCGPASCAGCCDAAGQCITATSSVACGEGGGACAACTRAETCVAGACVTFDAGTAGGTDAGACAGCRGCCANGVCRVGNITNACGTDGGVCDDCTVGGRVCVAGRCQSVCGPGNCAGCCRNNECITTTTFQACGRDGESCVLCQPREACVTGVCTPVDGGSGLDGGEACQATCPGCCDATGTCQLGTSQLACGNLGARCVVCNNNCRESPSTGGGRCL